MSKKWLLVCSVAGAMSVPRPARAVTVYADKDKGVSINVAALVQPQLQISKAVEPGLGSKGVGGADGKSVSTELFLRRARLMLYGNVTDNLSFFVEIDQPNMGKGGDFSVPTFVQDAFVTYKVVPALQIDMGLMLLPLSHQTLEGASSLHALDYHAELVRFPASKVFRDGGVQFRGMLFDDLVHYRLGVFEGVRPTTTTPPAGTPPPPVLNEAGMPRVAGQLRLNAVGAEKDFFLKGIYFSATPIVSFGVGGDVQPKAVLKDGAPATYWAVSGDAFVEYPFGADDELVAKANVFGYSPGVPGLPEGGYTLYGEAGFRHAWFEPLAFVDYAHGKDGSAKLVAPHVGMNFWCSKHTFNVKVDAGYAFREVNGATTSKDFVGTVQTQVFF